MNNNLPRVYASPINKNLTNNLEYHVSNINSLEVRDVKHENIPKKINEIFASPNHVYKSKVRIVLLNNEVLETTIIGKNGNYLLTLNGENISVNNILDIEKI